MGSGRGQRKRFGLRIAFQDASEKSSLNDDSSTLRVKLSRSPTEFREEAAHRETAAKSGSDLAGVDSIALVPTKRVRLLHPMPTPDDIKEYRAVLELMGSALLACQLAERTVSHAVQYILPKSGALTIEDVTKKKWLKIALGPVIQELHKRVEVNPKLSEFLANFNERRSHLAHDILRVEGHDYETREGRLRIAFFLRLLLEDANTVSKIFVTLAQLHAEQAGMEEDLRKRNPEFYGSDFYQEAERTMKPLISGLFRSDPRPTD